MEVLTGKGMGKHKTFLHGQYTMVLPSTLRAVDPPETDAVAPATATAAVAPETETDEEQKAAEQKEIETLNALMNSDDDPL